MTHGHHCERDPSRLDLIRIIHQHQIRVARDGVVQATSVRRLDDRPQPLIEGGLADPGFLCVEVGPAYVWSRVSFEKTLFKVQEDDHWWISVERIKSPDRFVTRVTITLHLPRAHFT